VKLLDSLLDAIVRLEGDALVMHVGEKPYVVTTSAAMSAYRGPLAWGQVELSSRVLTVDAVQAMLSQVLPSELCRALDELGAIEHEIASPTGVADQFTVVAARGGDDIWLELRRRPVVVVQEPEAEEQPAAAGAEGAGAAAEVGADAAPQPGGGGDVAVASPAQEPGPDADAGASGRDEIQERVSVLDEVGQHRPEHVEHVVISVAGRDGQEDVALDSVPGDAFEVVDEVPQEAPSDSEVDAMLAATASALLTSGLGTEVETVDDDLTIEHPALEIHEGTTSAEHDEHDGSVWSEVGVGDVHSAPPSEPAIAEPSPATPADGVFSGEASADEPAARSGVESPVVAPPQLEAEAHVSEPADERPSPAQDLQTPVEAGAGPLPVVEHVDDAAAAAVAPVDQEPAAERRDERLPVAAPEGPDVEPEPVVVEEPERGDVDAAPVDAPAVEEPPAAVGAVTPAAEPVIPEAAAAASAEPPASTAEPRTPVSETLAHPSQGATAPESYHQPHAAEGRASAVVPLGRAAARHGAAVAATLQSALRTAGARGAGTVYLVAQSKPVIRVKGEIIVLETEPVLSADDVQALVAELAPPQRQTQGEEIEWMSDVPGIGRVRCLTFLDHRGPGVIFRMDHAGLPAEVRALCTQPDGLVIIAGPHASGKSTLLNAFIDQINVSRGDHVITLESSIGFLHESLKSFISQRQQVEEPGRAAASARAALREDPDVLVIEDLRSADLANVALEAAESGRLVLATVTAPSAVAAIEQILESFPADRRGRAARSLASALRGVVSQVLVRRSQGGRAPAREVLLNTPSVASMIRDGRTGDLPSALESGRDQGLVSMTEALLSLVREGAVPAAEAYRKASDRTTLLARLKQEGVDTTFADRLV
jgi:twitching motility protein PilT